VVGDKEAATDAVSVRTRGKGDEGSVGLAEFIERAKGLVKTQAASL
jgi:threonyl-tRNA synthetase